MTAPTVTEGRDTIPPAASTISAARIDRVIARLDLAIAGVVNGILHHPDFQALEAAWRGLDFVVGRVAFEQNIEISVWSCTREELERDFEEASDITRSRFFREVYTAEYGQFGGRPFAAIFANYAIASAPEDIKLLRSMAQVAAMAHAPVFASAAPSMFRLDTFTDLPLLSDPAAVFDDPTFIRWHAFRQIEDSRYVGLLLPRMLMRLPYRDGGATSASFVYDERIDSRKDRLWGSPIFAFAVRLADSFARYRTASGLLGTFDDTPPVEDAYEALGGDQSKPPLEVLMSRRLELQLSELGFIPLTCDFVEFTLRFTTDASAQAPKVFASHEGVPAATLNHLLGTRVAHILVVSRFAHYVKVLQREKTGGHRTRDEVESDLNTWILEYVNQMPTPSAALRLLKPLRAARVRTSEVEGSPGWYQMALHIQPHLRYMGHVFTLSASSSHNEPAAQTERTR